MATTIQEPGECTPITDANAHNFQALVYEKAQDGAGIKLMGMVDWKTYLGFNEHKADNIANYIGINPAEFDISQPNPTLPQNPPGTILNRINHIANDCGLDITATPISDPTQTLDGRITTLQGQVQASNTGLLDRMTDAESEIESIQEPIGTGGGGGGGGTLTNRVVSLENKVGYYNESGKTDSGLMLDVHNIEEDVGHASNQSTSTPATGLHLAVETNTNDIGVEPDSLQNPPVVGSGLKKRCKDIENLNQRQSDDIRDIEDIVGVYGYHLNEKGTVSHRLDTIESGMSSVYKYVGDIVGCSYDLDGGEQRWYVLLTGNEKIYFDDFTDEYNGNVYNINPTTGDNVTINNISYTKGTNIAFIYNASAQTELKGVFDELGTAIDVSRIDDLENVVGDPNDNTGLCGEVQDLQDKFITDDDTETSWSSSNLNDGVYLIVGERQTSTFAAPKLESFIGFFQNNGQCVVHNDIKIESSNSFFNFNDSGVDPTYIVEATSPFVKVFITQIG